MSDFSIDRGLVIVTELNKSFETVKPFKEL